MRFSIPLEDVQALLASRELADAQHDVVAVLGARVVPEAFATPYQQSLNYAEIPLAEIQGLLSDERDLLARFTVRHLSSPDKPSNADGDFPQGEEPGPADRGRALAVLGYENGFLLQHAIYVVLARRGKDPLLRYLKWQRIPGAPRFCRQLLALLEDASQPS